MTEQSPDKMDFSGRFSAEVRAELARNRKTATSLSALLGIHEATVYRRLNGESDWPLDDAMTVAAHLGVSMTRLTQGSGA